MDPIQIAILNLLGQLPAGTAMNTDAIFNALTNQHLPIIQGRTQEHVRAAVRSMIRDHSQLIGSRSGFGPNNGYYIISNKDEAVETIMDLVDRSRKMLERVDALRNTWNNVNPHNPI